MLSRSLLFVPADKEKMLGKINALQSDIVLLDLEDAVALGDKDYARNLLIEHFHEINKPVFIRINSISTDDFQKDIQFIRNLKHADALQGIMLPKASAKGDITELIHHLTLIEQENQYESNLRIIPLVETALGVKNAYEIASANDRVLQLAFGGVDYLGDIDGQATANEHELLFARSQIVVSSRSAAINKPIDTVFTNIQDLTGFMNSCHYAKSLGFGGKLLIHPSQVDTSNEVFSPSSEEVEQAKKIIKSTENNNGAFQLDGKMIDKPIIEKARRIFDEIKKVENSNHKEA